MIHHFHRDQFVPGDAAQIWKFFSTPSNLAAITPAQMRFEIIGHITSTMYAGQMIQYRVGILPGLKIPWLTEITHVREGVFFVDEQRIGPYKLWHHEHEFTPTTDGRGVRMSDRITYDPGWGIIGGALDALWIRRQLAAIFDYRAVKVAELFPR